MKKLMLIAAAAALLGGPLLAVATSTPADAQVRVRSGENGVSVRVGPGADRHHHRADRHHHRHWRGHHARGRDCRVVRSRTETPSGRVIVRTREVCR